VFQSIGKYNIFGNEDKRKQEQIGTPNLKKFGIHWEIKIVPSLRAISSSRLNENKKRNRKPNKCKDY